MFVIVLENHSYSSIVGNPNAPWLNRAARLYGVARRYDGVAHPSQPNYIALTSGSTQGVTSDADVDLHVTSIVDQLRQHHRTWRAYMQSYTSGNGLYARKHDPFASYGHDENVVDFSRLSHDLASRRIASYSWITPDLCHDMHGAPGCGGDAALVRAGDAFTAAAVGAIMGSRAWTPGSLIFVTFDEGEPDEHVLTLVIRQGGGHVSSSRRYDHYSLLRTVEDHLGLGCLARACSARPMSDLAP